MEEESLAWYKYELEQVSEFRSDVAIDIYLTRGSVGQGYNDDDAGDRKSQADLFKTDSDGPSTSSSAVDIGTTSLTDPQNLTPQKAWNTFVSSLRISEGRPTLSHIVREEVSKAQGSVCVAGEIFLQTRACFLTVCKACGPEGFAIDAANAVSALQLDILRGSLPFVTEVYMKSETYGW